MHEIYERVSIRGHASFLPHGALFKTTRDILLVGDVWAVDTSPLELQNADTKRTATALGSRALHTRDKGMKSVAPPKGQEGPAKLVPTKGNSTSQALSTLRTLLAAKKLRRGEGTISMAVCRRNERLFGADARGRVKQLSGVKVEKIGDDYRPKEDSCIRAFIRLTAQAAAEEAVEV